MAKGETISKLYFNLGLDMSQLTADFIAADKTINENMARLNREKNLIKIKAEVDMAGLDAAKDKAKILEIQEKALTQQIDLQRQRISLAEAAYKDFCQRNKLSFRKIRKKKRSDIDDNEVNEYFTTIADVFASYPWDSP